MLLAGLSTRKNNKIILDTMTGWKEFSPLVEFESDSTLKQVQDGLVDGGNALLALLAAVHPDAGAVHAAVENIRSQLDFEDISDTWVTAHVLVGKKTRLIAKSAVRQVSFYILCSSTMLDVHVLNLLVVLRQHCRRSSTARMRCFCFTMRICVCGRKSGRFAWASLVPTPSRCTKSFAI